MSDGPSFADVVNPTLDEIRAWAYSRALEPMEDWEIIIAGPANVPLFIKLVADTLCPSRSYILRSLYCTVGHSDRSGPWLHEAVLAAEHSNEPWLRTWARRVREVVERPESFDRKDLRIPIESDHLFRSNPIADSGVSDHLAGVGVS